MEKHEKILAYVGLEEPIVFVRQKSIFSSRFRVFRSRKRRVSDGLLHLSHEYFSSRDVMIEMFCLLTSALAHVIRCHTMNTIPIISSIMYVQRTVLYEYVAASINMISRFKRYLYVSVRTVQYTGIFLSL